jgi:hypothetical protein
MTTLTTAVAAPASHLRRSHRLLIGLGLFSIAGAGVVTVSPAIAVQQGSGGQPSFPVVAATGVVLILLTGLFLLLVGRVLGLGGAWLLAATVSNAALIAYRFVVVPVSMYKTTYYLGSFSTDPNQRSTLVWMGVFPVLVLGVLLILSRLLAGHPNLAPAAARPRRQWRTATEIAIAVAAGVAIPVVLILGIGCLVDFQFEWGTVVAVTGGFLPCWLAAIWLFTTPAAFRAASWRASDVRDVTVVTASLWVALALLLAIHILWVVYVVAMAHLLPFKTVVPTSGK